MLLPQRKSPQRIDILSAQSVPGILDWFVVFILAVIAYVCFDQAYDMRVSMMHASELIRCIFDGKFLHFYGYIMDNAVTGSYYSAAAAYNIVVYITMGIWALPLYLLNMAFGFDNYDVLLSGWGRILVIGLSGFCAYLITRIAGKLTKDSTKAKWMGYFFLSSPIFFFCVIIQNQYDIFSVTLTLLALFFYLDKKYYKFSALMSLAVCYKLFPLLVFFPLILLAEKKIAKLIQYAAISVIPYIMTTMLFSISDSGYQRTQQSLKSGFDFFGRVYAAQIAEGESSFSIFIVLVILICVISYYVKPKQNDFAATAFTLCSASFASFFIFVEWHPQWFIIILPFLTLMVFSMKNFQLGVMLETAVSAAYLLAAAIYYMTFYMMNNSLLVRMTWDYFTLSDNANPLYNIWVSQGYSYVPVRSLFVGCLAALILVAYKDLKSKEIDINRFEYDIKINRSMLYLRSLTILIYILPPVVYYLSSPIV